jgi:hypothetical protein
MLAIRVAIYAGNNTYTADHATEAQAWEWIGRMLIAILNEHGLQTTDRIEIVRSPN